MLLYHMKLMQKEQLNSVETQALDHLKGKCVLTSMRNGQAITSDFTPGTRHEELFGADHVGVTPMYVCLVVCILIVLYFITFNAALWMGVA